jgi:hypothetical protein
MTTTAAQTASQATRENMLTAHARWVEACDAVAALNRLLNSDRSYDGQREALLRPLRRNAAVRELQYNEAAYAWNDDNARDDDAGYAEACEDVSCHCGHPDCGAC